ncbi:MAG: hypothetical protein AB7I48_26475 [Planctomycetaceae bacterium]
MTFLEVAEEYIAYKRSLGMTYGVQARNLRIFARACAGCEIREVTSEVIHKFLSQQTPFMRSRH